MEGITRATQHFENHFKQNSEGCHAIREDCRGFCLLACSLLGAV